MAFAAVERLIAFRYLRARREEGFISVIAGFSLVGITLGVGTLIVVMSVMNGFRVEMLRQMSSISGQLGVQGTQNGLEATPDLLARVRAVPGVISATPAVEGQVMAVAGDHVRGVVLRGMQPDDFRARTPLAASIEGPPEVRGRYRALCRGDDDKPIDWGSLKAFGNDFSVVIGRRLADLLGLKVGDRLQLVSPVSIVTPFGVMPRSAAARVAAIFCAGMYDYDANFVYAPLVDAQRLLDIGGRVTGIEVFVGDDASISATRRLVSQVIGTQGWVFDWQQANVGFFSAIQAQTNVMFLVLTMIVLVAAFNIVSSLVMLVRTKTADIAILRTMGASRGAILRVFLLDGLAIGGIGTILGVVLGLAFARNIEAIRQWLQSTFDIVLFDETLYLLAELPSRIEWAEVAVIAGMALVFALLASLYPAARAADSTPWKDCVVSDAAPAVERWLAWRYLATRQREGFVSFIATFSLIGVALGVATLIVVLSVMGGFRQQLLGRIIGMNGHIVITARDGMVQATPELLAKLKDFPGVRAVHLMLERQVLVAANGQTRGALLRGVRPEDLMSREIVTKNVVHGELGTFGTRPGVVMGERLRQALNVRAGDKVTLVTHKLNENGTIAPRYTDYELLASFLTRRFEFDGALVFVPLATLQDDLEYGDQAVSSIDLDIADPAAAPQLAGELRKVLGRDDLKVADWLGLNARFVGALQVERVMMFIILTLIVVVAAMNVVASFTMLVRVKRGSIAILRTMGASPRTIVRAFFMSAAAVGLVGTTLGTALGLLVCANMPSIGALLAWITGAAGSGSAEVDFITSMPVRVQPVEVASVIVVAIVLSLAAAAYPAWRSTRVEPVEGLRHE